MVSYLLSSIQLSLYRNEPVRRVTLPGPQYESRIVLHWSEIVVSASCRRGRADLYFSIELSQVVSHLLNSSIPVCLYDHVAFIASRFERLGL